MLFETAPCIKQGVGGAYCFSHLQTEWAQELAKELLNGCYSSGLDFLWDLFIPHLSKVEDNGTHEIYVFDIPANMYGPLPLSPSLFDMMIDVNEQINWGPLAVGIFGLIAEAWSIVETGGITAPVAAKLMASSWLTLCGSGVCIYPCLKDNYTCLDRFRIILRVKKGIKPPHIPTESEVIGG